jgi:serine/threonine protein kinase
VREVEREGEGSLQGLSIGSFSLQRTLARGGMGTVWRAQHRGGAPAAVKIITRRDKSAPVDITAMQAEIRAVGALDHPNIVYVYDAGTLTEEHEQASRGALAAGSPWLAMELAAGPVSDLADRFDWALFQTLLLQVLDALGHAHARGVIHRDMKPANLLYVRGPELRVMLADFGLAWQLRGTDVLQGGSLPYAAPEQILGLQAEQGPGTDLYSLGCSVYRLVCNARPFREREPEALARAHLSSPIPELEPTFPVSPELDDWLRGMLAKDPRDRFQCAADAAWALRQLPPPRSPIAFEDEITVEYSDPGLGHELFETEGTLFLGDTLSGRLLDAPTTAEDASLVRPPVPDDWVRPQQGRPPPLGGRGLGLFGLRVPAMVGRNAERDLLWDLLRKLVSPQLVVLRGGTGLGKSRLASWLAERAYETGAASVFRTTFAESGPGGGSGPRGLALLLEEHLRTRGLEVEPLLRHLQGRFGQQLDTLSLARLLRPEAPMNTLPALPGPLTSSERLSLVRRVVELAAVQRRTVVCLDDVQHGGLEPVELVEAVAASGSAVLFVVTAQDVPAALDARWHALVDRLQGFDVTLGPLSSVDMATLVSRMLPVEPELATRIAELVGGSPLGATELVRHLVERGAMRGDPSGVWLESLDQLAASLADRWEGALSRLEGLEGARVGLHVAALLGRSFSHTEWRDTMARLGQKPAQGLLGALVGRGFLLTESQGRSTFAHPSLRELLLGQARELGPELDLACAEMLCERGEPFAGRAAAHYEAAGAQLRAAEIYLRAVRWLSGWDQHRAMEVAGRWFLTLLRAQDRREGDLQELELHWTRGMSTLASLQAEHGRDAPRRALEVLLGCARQEADALGETQALVELSRLDVRALALDRAEARAELAVHRSRGTSLSLAAVAHRAHIRRVRGDLRGAERTLLEALAHHRDDKGEQDSLPALLELARVLVDAGRAGEAEMLLSGRLSARAKALQYVRLKRTWAHVLMALGRALEAADALAEAGDLVRAALVPGSPERLLVELDHGEALLAADQSHRAHAVLSILADELDRGADARALAHTHAALADLSTRAADARERVGMHLSALELLRGSGHRRATLAHLQSVDRWARAHGYDEIALGTRRWLDPGADDPPPLDGGNRAE